VILSLLGDGRQKFSTLHQPVALLSNLLSKWFWVQPLTKRRRRANFSLFFFYPTLKPHPATHEKKNSSHNKRVADLSATARLAW